MVGILLLIASICEELTNPKTKLFKWGLGLYYKQDGTNDFIKISTDYGATNFCKSSTEDILYIKTAYYGSIKYLSGTTYGTCGTDSFTIGEYAQMLDFGQYIIYCKPFSRLCQRFHADFLKFFPLLASKTKSFLVPQQIFLENSKKLSQGS